MRPRRLLTHLACDCVALLTALAPSWAAAEPRAPQPVAADGARLRFGLTGGAAAGRAVAQGATPLLNVTPALDLDLGVQAQSAWAFYAHLQGGTVIVSTILSAYGVAEWTPTPWFSVGTGLGYDAQFMPDLCSDSSGTGPYHGGFGGTCGGGWSGLSVPVILGVNFENREEWHRELARQTLRLQLTGAYGVDPVSGITGGHLGLTFGYAEM